MYVCLPAYGCVAVMVKQLRGTGDVVVPDDVDIAVVEAFRVALFWARMNEAGKAGRRKSNNIVAYITI